MPVRSARRSAISISVRDEVLREAGYMCGNPRCRHILTLDLHHIVWVKDGGGDAAENLIALCPNCHALHTQGHIPPGAIRHWKGLLHALNHAFNKEGMDLLLYLQKPGIADVWYTGDGLLRFAGLIAGDFVEVVEQASASGKTEKYAEFSALVVDPEGSLPLPYVRTPTTAVRVRLSTKGRLLVESWLAGDEDSYRRALREG